MKNLFFNFYYDGYEKLNDIAKNIFISTQFKKGTVVYFFGASNINSFFGGYIEENCPDLMVGGYLDNNKAIQGKCACGLEIISPDMLHENDGKTIIVLATSHNDEMLVQLESKGYFLGNGVYIALDMREYPRWFYPFKKDIPQLSEEEVKKHQLENLLFFRDFCNEHGIRYYLAYGTMLGAIRHRGYIPWDDDIDVYIYESDMDKIEKLINEDDDSSYQIISYKNTNIFIFHHILLVNTDVVKERNLFPTYYTTGVSIDIWPLYGVDADDKLRQEKAWTIFEENLQMQYSYGLQRPDIRTHMKNAVKEFCTPIIDETKYIGCIYSPYMSKDVLKREWFEEEEMVTFENHQFKIPKGYDQILKQIYGDYMKLPPENKRVHQHVCRHYLKNDYNENL